MKNRILLIIILLTPMIMQAQQKWKLWGVSEAGILTGSYGPSGDLRLQGGLEKKGWMFGAGAAYDGYRYETFPVYGQIRKMFGKKKMKPFLTSSFGANFETEDDNPYDNMVFASSNSSIWAQPAYTYTPGIYAELGAGLAFRTHKTFGYNLSFTYTRKTLTEGNTYMIMNGDGAGETTTSSTKYLLNRWAFRIAMQID